MTTSEKLTAKLSDGTSGELVHTASMGKEKLYKFVTFKPSPPKEVYVVTNESGVLATYLSDVSDEYKGTSAIVHRYILAPESGKEPECVTCGKEMERIGGSNKNYFCRYCVEPKPAREWWEVQDTQGNVVSYHPEPTREAAVENCLKCKSQEPDRIFRVVHVREVPND